MNVRLHAGRGYSAAGRAAGGSGLTLTPGREEERPRQLLGKGPRYACRFQARRSELGRANATRRLQRDVSETSDYPHFLLDAVEKQFGKPADFDNRTALVNFTIDDFDDALARDPMVVAARLEEERNRANGFAGYKAD